MSSFINRSQICLFVLGWSPREVFLPTQPGWMDGWKDGDNGEDAGGSDQSSGSGSLYAVVLVLRLVRDLISCTDPIWDECVSRAQTCRHRVASLSPS